MVKSFIYKTGFPVVFTIVTAGSLLPQKQISRVDWMLSDKWLHMLMYLVLSSALFLFWIRLDHQSSIKKIIVFTSLISIGYGILMEVMQYYLIEGRYGETLDVLANTIGVLITLGLTLILNTFKLKFR